MRRSHTDGFTTFRANSRNQTSVFTPFDPQNKLTIPSRSPAPKEILPRLHFNTRQLPTKRVLGVRPGNRLHRAFRYLRPDMDRRIPLIRYSPDTLPCLCTAPVPCGSAMGRHSVGIVLASRWHPVGVQLALILAPINLPFVIRSTITSETLENALSVL